MELPHLTEYHWQKSRDAQKAVREMLKHPMTREESEEQIIRLFKGNLVL